MNATLAQYVSQFETLEQDAQEGLSRRIEDFFEERMIDRKLLQSVERGGRNDPDEVFDRLENKLKEHGLYDNN